MHQWSSGQQLRADHGWGILFAHPVTRVTLQDLRDREGGPAFPLIRVGPAAHTEPYRKADDNKQSCQVLRCSGLRFRAVNDETAVSELSVMRDEDCQAEENFIKPVTLDFERNSCLESDPR